MSDSSRAGFVVREIVEAWLGNGSTATDNYLVQCIHTKDHDDSTQDLITRKNVHANRNALFPLCTYNASVLT